ncbi:MAG: hypothetical protein ACK4ZJ_18940, partial [Allorhizobium sp.]
VPVARPLDVPEGAHFAASLLQDRRLALTVVREWALLVDRCVARAHVAPGGPHTPVPPGVPPVCWAAVPGFAPLLTLFARVLRDSVS